MSRETGMSTEQIASQWDSLEHTFQAGWNMYQDHLYKESQEKAEREREHLGSQGKPNSKRTTYMMD